MNVNITAEFVRNAIAADGGFSWSVRDDRPLVVGQDTGWAVAVPGTEHTLEDLTDAVLASVVEDALDDAVRRGFDADQLAVGGWHGGGRGYMVEVTTVVQTDRTTATILGEIRDQDAVFNLATGEEVRTRFDV